MNSIKRCVLGLASGLLLAVGAGNGLAQDFPKRPVRFVLTFGAPGGSPDTIARAVGARLTEMWGVQVVIDPRPGAGGMLATEIVARTTPDGYTIMLVSPSHVINPALHAKVAYDPFKDFAPVTQAAEVPNILSIYPGVPARTMKDLIALAKARPGSLSYGSAGSGSSQHLAGELFREMAEVEHRQSGPDRRPHSDCLRRHVFAELHSGRPPGRARGDERPAQSGLARAADSGRGGSARL